MTDTFRALCDELLLFAEQAGKIASDEGLWPECDPTFSLLDRFRSALAQSEPDLETLPAQPTSTITIEQAELLQKLNPHLRPPLALHQRFIPNLAQVAECGGPCQLDPLACDCWLGKELTNA